MKNADPSAKYRSIKVYLNTFSLYRIECVALCAKYNGGGACNASRFDRQTRTCQIKASPHAQGNNVWLANDQTWDTFAVRNDFFAYT